MSDTIRDDETKAERFSRVAGRRIQNVLDAIAVLGNCSDRNTYEFTDEQVAKIEQAITSTLNGTIAKFRNGSGKKTSARVFEI